MEEVARGRWKKFTAVAGRSPSRWVEEVVRGTQWEDFNWNKHEVAVKNKPQFNHTIKTYEGRNVPIPEQLIYKLLPFKKESGICFPVPGTDALYSLQGPKLRLNSILVEAGIKEKKARKIKGKATVVSKEKDADRKGLGEGFHTFRRTFASRLVQEGISIEKVSRWLGHSSISVTEKYYADFKPRYDSDIEKLNITAPADHHKNIGSRELV